MKDDIGHRENQLKLSEQALLAERHGTLPVWVRAPVKGQEFYSGLTRAKLYEWAASGRIRTTAIREPGKLKGLRLFHLQSILDFIARCEVKQAVDASSPADEREALVPA